jgi:hypothetical protein
MFSLTTEDFNTSVRRGLSFLEDPYVSTGLTLFLLMYAGLAAPKLPKQVASLLKNPVVSLVVLFVVAYMNGKNPTAALLATVGLVVSMMTLNRYEVADILDPSELQEDVVDLGQEVLDVGKRIGKTLLGRDGAEAEAEHAEQESRNGVQECIHGTHDVYAPELQGASCGARALHGEEGGVGPLGVESCSSRRQLHL